MVTEVHHPTMGKMLQAAPPPNFSKSPAAPSSHAPALGENTDEILTELGTSEAERAELHAKGIVG